MSTLTLPEVTPVKAKTVFFPNLDGLRAIAAFLVVVSHVEPLKEKVNLQPFATVDMAQLGKIGVGIFFALSGFLITYLLLEEKNAFQSVDYKKFYIRRVLRIWPLYFLVLLFGYLIYPRFDSATGFWLSVFFLANVAFVMELLPALIAPIWSIGVEEQFYIFQPHLLRFKRLKTIFFTTIAFILFFWALDILVGWPVDKTSPQLYVKRFLTFARFDSMLTGSVFAMILFSKSKVQQAYPSFWKILVSRYTQLAVSMLFIGYLLLVLLAKFPISHQLISGLSSVLIINLAQTKSSIINLQHPLLMKAGKISYGIYLLHKFAIVTILYVGVRYFHAGNGVVDNMLLYGLSIISSYFLAHVIYYNYEVYFMKLKSKFGIIHKG